MSLGRSSGSQSSTGSSQQSSSNSSQSVNFGSSQGSSSSSSSSRSSTADELRDFYDAFNAATGGVADRRANQSALNYQQLTPQSVRALGGLGSTRKAAAERAFEKSIERIEADSSLTLEQKQRSAELVADDFQSNIDGIARETDAELTRFIQGENLNQFQAGVQSRDSDLAAAQFLAQLFFGGKGQTSSSTSQSQNSSSSFGEASSEGQSQGTSTQTSRGRNSGVNIGF